jgi:hypothetical protein
MKSMKIKTMRAIEFTTDTKDGIIQIPKKYLKNLKKNIRVIILIEEEEKKIKVKTKGLSFAN